MTVSLASSVFRYEVCSLGSCRQPDGSFVHFALNGSMEAFLLAGRCGSFLAACIITTASCLLRGVRSCSCGLRVSWA